MRTAVAILVLGLMATAIQFGLAIWGWGGWHAFFAHPALDALYHKVSYNGFVIVDDFHLAGCASAVQDFRKQHNITAPILPIDGHGVWWRVDHHPIGM